MYFVLASPTAQQNSLTFIAYLTRRSILLSMYVLSFDLLILNFPQMVNQQAKVMCEVMWGAISDCSNHQSLLSWSIADITIPSLALFFVSRPSKPAAMASILYLLAVLVDSNGAFRTLLYGVAHFRKIAETGRAWCPKMVLGAFIEFRLFVKNIFFKVSKSKNPVEFLFVKPVVFIGFNGFVIVEEVYGGLKEGLAQVLDNKDLDILVLKIAVCWTDLKLAVLQEIIFVETLPHLLEDLILELVTDLAEGQDLQFYIFERHIAVAQLLSQRVDKPLHSFLDFRPPMVQVVLIGTQKPEIFEVSLPRIINSKLSQQGQGKCFIFADKPHFFIDRFLNLTKKFKISPCLLLAIFLLGRKNGALFVGEDFSDVCVTEHALPVLLVKGKLIVSKEGRVTFDELGNGRQLIFTEIDDLSTLFLPMLFFDLLVPSQRLQLITLAVPLLLLLNAWLILFPHLFSRLFHIIIRITVQQHLSNYNS